MQRGEVEQRQPAGLVDDFAGGLRDADGPGERRIAEAADDAQIWLRARISDS